MNKAALMVARILTRWRLTRAAGERLALAAWLSQRGAPATYGAGQGRAAPTRRRPTRRAHHQGQP